MLHKYILVGIATVLVLLMIFGNKKVRLLSVVLKQFQVFKNAKTGKISMWDIVCFVVNPVILATIITIGFDCTINDTLAGVLTTVFSFIFTVLFGFAAILVGKLESKNDIEKQVVAETFISIMTSNVLSLVSAILSIAIIITENTADLILSIVVYSFSFMILMLLMMISKRTFIIYCNNSD